METELVRTREGGHLHDGLAVLAAGAVGVVILLPPTTTAAIAAPLVAVSVAALGALLALEHRRPGLHRSVVFGASGVVIALAVLMPVHRSNDLWQYAFYGRLVSHYHLSPYNHSPYEFPHDLVYPRLTPVWHHRPSVYGPLFTALSAIGTGLAGSSVLAIRLWFQTIAALAVVAILVLVDRRTREPAAVAVIGLNPVVLLYVVSGGHNDALVGLAILGAVLLVERRRTGAAGLALAAAALIKVSTAIALLPLAWWTLRHRGRREAAVLVATTSLTTLGAYAVSGGRAVLAPLRAASYDVSWTSVWKPLAGTTSLDLAHDVGRLGLAVVLVVALVLVWGAVDDGSPVRATTGALVAYVLLAPYVLVWYVCWALPLLALRWRSAMTSLVLACSAVMLLASEHRGLQHPDYLDDWLHDCRDLLRIMAWSVAAILLALAAWERLRRSPPTIRRRSPGLGT